METCVGPPDAVSKGAFTTLIGAMPAARISDQSIHQGLLVQGLPTVLIGDAPANVTVVQRGNCFIIVDRDHKKIYMVGFQEFSGDGADQAFVDRALKSINKTWSGTTTFEGETYTVDCMMTGALGSGNPMATQWNVKKTTLSPAESRQKDPANAYPNGPVNVHANEDGDGGLTIPHEFGHTMGLPDEYKEGPKDKDGNRTLTRTGPKGGLMGYIDPGSKPTADNYNSLITGKGLNPKAVH
jgi:hypothetical protein